MYNQEYLEERYIKTKNKIRKIVTYKEGENPLRKKHEQIEKYLCERCKSSIFAKAYIQNSSISKNAKAHMYNDVFVFFDVKDFFPSINHNYLVAQLYKELKKQADVSINSCSKLVDICSVHDKGLPLGLVTSPILSNIYMKEFDNILYGKLKRIGLDNIIYTRYADDIVISYKCDGIREESVQQIKECVYLCLKKVHLKSNEKKERVFFIKKGGHVRVTGINIICDENNFRTLTVGRKKKDRLFNDAVNYVLEKNNDTNVALQIKGYESFVLSVEGSQYENCFSNKMKDLVKEMGYSSLHELIRSIEVK